MRATTAATIAFDLNQHIVTEKEAKRIAHMSLSAATNLLQTVLQSDDNALLYWFLDTLMIENGKISMGFIYDAKLEKLSDLASKDEHYKDKVRSLQLLVIALYVRSCNVFDKTLVSEKSVATVTTKICPELQSIVSQMLGGGYEAADPAEQTLLQEIEVFQSLRETQRIWKQFLDDIASGEISISDAGLRLYESDLQLLIQFFQKKYPNINTDKLNSFVNIDQVSQVLSSRLYEIERSSQISAVRREWPPFLKNRLPSMKEDDLRALDAQRLYEEFLEQNNIPRNIARVVDLDEAVRTAHQLWQTRKNASNARREGAFSRKGALQYDDALHVITIDLERAILDIGMQRSTNSGATILQVDGEAFSGKTWLAMHEVKQHAIGSQKLYISLGKKSSVFSLSPRFFLGLGEDSMQRSIRTKMRDNLVVILQVLGFDVGANMTFDATPELITQGAWTNKKKITLFIDDISGISQTTLHLFKHFFLSPLSSFENVSIVLLDAPSSSCDWYDLKYTNAEKVTLPPLTHPQVAELTDKLIAQGFFLEETDPTTLLEYSGGNAGLVTFFARNGIEFPDCNRFLHTLLDREINESLVFYLKLLAPLDGFNQDMIEHLRDDAWFGNEDPYDKDERSLVIRERLLDTHLVRWDNSAAYFRIDPALQQLLNLWMKDYEPQRWSKIREAMVGYFAYWAEEARKEGEEKIAQSFEKQREFYQ
ncbi:MAG: hypothetical protein H6774_02510 [Pseudomonadales bacterium]|nr:hypothetical protein [Pseudomonadales bacterium]